MQNVFRTPFYSQYRDIKNKKWKKKACGIAALAMMCEYHRPQAEISLPRLITEGTKRGGYQKGVGWKHKALAELCGIYALRGKNFDLAKKPFSFSQKQLKASLRKGPVVVSVWRDPKKRSGGHLVTAVGFDTRSFLLKDPLERTDGAMQKRVTWKTFGNIWKKRMVVASPKRRVAKK